MINIITENLQLKKQIQGIFNSIAPKYDFVNTIISFGMHHYWRKIALKKANPPKGGTFLDACCGTGAITLDLAKRIGPGGKIVGLDFSEPMLNIAKKRLAETNLKSNVEFICGNVENLPFPNETFDCAFIGYGLRNVPEPQQVLGEIKRVVKVGGRVISLEIVKPSLPVFRELYYLYLNHWVPFIGKITLNNKEAYRYFYHSIISFIHQNELTRMYKEIGFVKVESYELTLGVVAIHIAIRT